MYIHYICISIPFHGGVERTTTSPGKSKNSNIEREEKETPTHSIDPEVDFRMYGFGIHEAATAALNSKAFLREQVLRTVSPPIHLSIQGSARTTTPLIGVTAFNHIRGRVSK